MKITYISHATLLIEVNDLKIVTDPWVKGSSYVDQWHLFPKPLSPELVQAADVVLYSHGHEDHLHPESLLTINKSAKVFYPYSWYDGTTEFFHEMGFQNIKEVLNEQTLNLGNGITATYLSNNLDNVIVIEANGQVLVNINDALPSASKGMIEHFISKLKKRWPKIDYVFSSYGGASYFPNTVHFADKNDVEIAETREQFFLANFCRIIEGLAPTFAIPFASDFVLLEDHQRWINHTKFPRHKIREFFQQAKPNCNSQVIEAYPNDYFENGDFHKTSKYHAVAEEMINTIDVDYAEEIARKRQLKTISKEELSTLTEKLKKHILHKQYIIPAEIRSKTKFAIKITDAGGSNILTTDFRQAETQFNVANTHPEDCDLLIEVKSKTLDYAISNEWGGDAIVIGYGAEIFVFNQAALELDIENHCVRLLGRYPNTKEYLKRTPIRTARYLLSDSTKRNNLINTVIGRKEKVINYFDPILTNRNLWLSKSKCEVCKACNL